MTPQGGFPQGGHTQGGLPREGTPFREGPPRRAPREPKRSPGGRQEESRAAGGSPRTAQNGAPEAQECQVEAPKNAACPRGSLNESTPGLAKAMLAKAAPREPKNCPADAQREQKNTVCPRGGPQRNPAQPSATQRKSGEPSANQAHTKWMQLSNRECM